MTPRPSDITPPQVSDFTPWVGLADCPEDAYRWAALGYAAGLVDGRAAVLASIADAGRTVAKLAAPILRQPTHAELHERRYGGR